MLDAFGIILPWINGWTIALYIVLAIIGWLLILTFEYGLNSGQLGRGRFWVFECLWEDILMNIPGGTKRKADNIRERVESSGPNVSGTFASFSIDRSWTYEKLRETGDYEACGLAMHGSAWSFWFTRVFLYGIVAFFFAPYVITAVIVSLPLYIVSETLSRALQWNPLKPDEYTRRR